MGSKSKVTVFVASSGKQIGYPQPLSNQRKIVMGSRGRGAEGNKSDNYFCFLWLLNYPDQQQLFHTHAKINHISRGWFKWFEVKYGPNDTLY